MKTEQQTRVELIDDEERKKVIKRDLIQSPFIVIHPQGIRGVFNPAQINGTLTLTANLTV